MVVVIDHLPRNREHQEPQGEEILMMMEKAQGKEDGMSDPQGEVGNRAGRGVRETVEMREWLTRTS